MAPLPLVDLGVGPYIHEVTSKRFPVYTRGNAGEVWPEVAYPLSISLTRTFDDPLTAAMVQTGLVTEADVIEGSSCAAGVFGGYMYLNLSLSRVIAVRSPGVTIEESDAMYLGSEGVAPGHPPNKADRSWRASVNAIRYMIGVLRTKSLDELKADQALVSSWKRNLPEMLAADDAQLLAHMHSLVPVAMELFSRHLEVTGKAGAAVQFLSGLCEKQLDDRGRALSLLTSIGDVDSAAPSRALWKLGRLVFASPGLTTMFDAGLDDLYERLAAAQIATSFNAGFANFLEEFGARGPNEWETASPTWGTQPRLALALIDRLRLADEKQDPVARATRLTSEREALTDSTRRELSRAIRWQFDRALAAATLFSAGRERTKTTVVELIHVSRLLARELAGRAATKTATGQLDDMWFCLEHELDDYIAEPAAFTEIIAARRETRNELAARVPPFVFEGEMPPVSSWPLRAEVTETNLTAGESIDGLAAVPGVAEGRACIVTDPFNPGDLGPGDVLIAPLTDPAWTPLFMAAEAVVVDVGGQMSHAVIVAREFGMPCVVAATDATKRIPHGARVRVDANAGSVTLL